MMRLVRGAGSFDPEGPPFVGVTQSSLCSHWGGKSGDAAHGASTQEHSMAGGRFHFIYLFISADESRL